MGTFPGFRIEFNHFAHLDAHGHLGNVPGKLTHGVTLSPFFRSPHHLLVVPPLSWSLPTSKPHLVLPLSPSKCPPYQSPLSLVLSSLPLLITSLSFSHYPCPLYYPPLFILYPCPHFFLHTGSSSTYSSLSLYPSLFPLYNPSSIPLLYLKCVCFFYSSPLLIFLSFYLSFLPSFLPCLHVFSLSIHIFPLSFSFFLPSLHYLLPVLRLFAFFYLCCHTSSHYVQQI